MKIKVLKSRAVEVPVQVKHLARESSEWKETDPSRPQPSHVPLNLYMDDLENHEPGMDE